MVKSAPPISSMSPLAPVSELIWTLAKLGTAGKPRIFAVPCASKSSPVYMRSTLNARGAHTVSVSCMMFPPEVFDEPDSFRVAAVRIILKKIDETVGQGRYVGASTGWADRRAYYGARLPALRIRFSTPVGSDTLPGKHESPGFSESWGR